MTTQPKEKQRRSSKHQRNFEIADQVLVVRDDQTHSAHTPPALAADGKRMLSVKEFCHRYGIGRTMAYDEIDAGRLRSVKRGGRRLVPVDAAEAWANGQSPTVGTE